MLVPVTLNIIPTPKPVITSIQNGASYFLGAVSPGENVTMKGSGLGPATLTMGRLGQNGLVATTVANTQVMFDNVAAPIIYVSATQTSVVVPYEVFGRPQTTVTIMYQGVTSDPVAYNVVPVAPGIYTLNMAGFGQGAIFDQDGQTVNGPSTPAAKGSVIALYLTGEGPTAPQGVDGAIPPSDRSQLKHPLAKVTATAGGIPATVYYAGSAPGIVSGISQINVVIPPNAPSAPNVPILLIFTTSGYAAGTQPGVTVAVDSRELHWRTSRRQQLSVGRAARSPPIKNRAMPPGSSDWSSCRPRMCGRHLLALERNNNEMGYAARYPAGGPTGSSGQKPDRDQPGGTLFYGFPLGSFAQVETISTPPSLGNLASLTITAVPECL